MSVMKCKNKMCSKVAGETYFRGQAGLTGIRDIDANI